MLLPDEIVTLGLASMRPRLFTAENIVDDGGFRWLGEASMRPRLFTAENLRARGLQGTAPSASMRPRLFTAENGEAEAEEQAREWGFNEAAALHRGKPALRRTTCRALHRFNEAAALHRGKPPSTRSAHCS